MVTRAGAVECFPQNHDLFNFMTITESFASLNVNAVRRIDPNQSHPIVGKMLQGDSMESERGRDCQSHSDNFCHPPAQQGN
jgi:hypothetical protein